MPIIKMRLHLSGKNKIYCCHNTDKGSKMIPTQTFTLKHQGGHQHKHHQADTFLDNFQLD